jgi:hypothetical protein
MIKNTHSENYFFLQKTGHNIPNIQTRSTNNIPIKKMKKKRKEKKKVVCLAKLHHDAIPYESLCC